MPKSVKNSDFATEINEIYVELSENSQRYVIECCEPESNGTINGFGAGCCKCRGGVAAGLWYKYIFHVSLLQPYNHSTRPPPDLLRIIDESDDIEGNEE
jgi:hypothetical protein